MKIEEDHPGRKYKVARAALLLYVVTIILFSIYRNDDGAGEAIKYEDVFGISRKKRGDLSKTLLHALSLSLSNTNTHTHTSRHTQLPEITCKYVDGKI